MKNLFIAILLCFSSISFTQVFDTVYLYRDTIHQGNVILNVVSFSPVDSFVTTNAVINMDAGETLNLTVINRDTVDHSLVIDDYIESNNSVAVNDTVDFVFQPSENGTFRYYSGTDQGKYLGASGIILVGYQNYSRFYWNLYDHNDTLASEFANGTATGFPTEYRPSVFLINNYTFPHTLTDTLSYVTGNVGDTIVIACINSGYMPHSLHFHGYHVRIESVRKRTHTLFWDKDTYPLIPGEAVLFRLIPDQEGMYPVHDHNLITVTNTGAYPGGMITRLNIQP